MNSYTLKKVNGAPNWDAIEALNIDIPYRHETDVQAWAKLCWDETGIHVNLRAKEENIRCQELEPLSPICEDSCLEFFFAPLADDKRYFNFEWNLLGALYLGFGAERNTRVRQIVKDVNELFAPNCFKTAEGWGVEFKIPASYIQLYMPEFKLEGEAACNFYKCGDKTDVKHYLAWASLSSEKPDYHRRQDFAKIVFE